MTTTRRPGRVVLQIFLQRLGLPPQPIGAGSTDPVEVDLRSLANGVRLRGLRPVLDQFIHLVEQHVDIIQRFRFLERSIDEYRYSGSPSVGINRSRNRWPISC